jgi:hypothetical protein
VTAAFAEGDQSIRAHIGEPDVRHDGGRVEPRELRDTQRDLAASDLSAAAHRDGDAAIKEVAARPHPPLGLNTLTELTSRGASQISASQRCNDGVVQAQAFPLQLPTT